ncbi:MAG: hypothetical protein ACRC3H_05305 [Lachnospiraceae bacterium]
MKMPKGFTIKEEHYWLYGMSANAKTICTKMTKEHPQMTNKDLLILTLKLFGIWIAGAIIQAL